MFSPAKYPSIIGGMGSGKTYGGTTRVLHLLGEEPGISIAYYMPTYDLLRLRAIPGLEEELERRNFKSTLNKSEYTLTIPKLGQIYFRSYDTPKRIIAYEVSHSIVDELDTLDREKAATVWRKVTERNRGATTHLTGNTIGNVTTPDQGLSGFTYSRWGHLIDPNRLFKMDEQKKYHLIRAPTYTNVCIPGGVEDYIAQIREGYDPIMAEMYIEGLFVSLSQDKVYHFFNRNEHHTSMVLDDSDKVLHVSIDFNIGGCCSVVWLITDNKPYAVKEFVSHDTRDFCIKLSKFKRKNRKIKVYPDATGGSESTNASESDLAIIRGAGYTVDCPNGNPAIRDRVNSMNGLFSHNRISINTNECSRFTEALEAQGYDKKGKPEKFNEHPSLDDWTDSAGYFVHRKFPIIKPIIITDIRTAM